MKFGLKQLYEKTPKLMVRIGLACKAIAASTLAPTLNGSKIAAIVAIIGIIGAFLVAFFGEEYVDQSSN